MVIACGGGGGGVSVPPVAQKLVGEVIANPAQLASADIASTAGYSGDIAASRAIALAGKQNLLDLLFVISKGIEHGVPMTSVSQDAELRLKQYVASNADLLVPGIRVLIADEVYWNTQVSSDSMDVLLPQLDAIKAAVALVRKHIPQAAVGITVSPYAAMGKPNTLDVIKKTIALVDWVATDPYWFGDVTLIPELHAWSRSFHALAKQVNPRVETWFVAQAFKFAHWDTTVFNQFIAEELAYGEQYDHIMFFGWQFVSELDMAAAGIHFPPETRLIYKKYLK